MRLLYYSTDKLSQVFSQEAPTLYLTIFNLITVLLKYPEGFEMWYWRRWGEISWTDRVKNEVLRRVKE